MTAHVFTEDQTTLEWYVDGIPVAELKRRYEAHDALVKALRKSRDAMAGTYDVNDYPANGKTDCDMAIVDADIALAAAEVRSAEPIKVTE